MVSGYELSWLDAYTFLYEVGTHVVYFVFGLQMIRLYVPILLMRNFWLCLFMLPVFILYFSFSFTCLIKILPTCMYTCTHNTKGHFFSCWVQWEHTHTRESKQGWKYSRYVNILTHSIVQNIFWFLFLFKAHVYYCEDLISVKPIVNNKGIAKYTMWWFWCILLLSTSSSFRHTSLVTYGGSYLLCVEQIPKKTFLQYICRWISSQGSLLTWCCVGWDGHTPQSISDSSPKRSSV